MTQLVRHGAPVYGEIVGELLSVKGNIKRRTSGSARLARKTAAQRRLADVRARKLAGARLRVPLRVPRAAAHGLSLIHI